MKFKLGSFFNLDNLDSSIEAVGETRELAELIQDQKIKNIAPWVSNLAPFLKPLASPEAQLVSELSEAILPFIKITGALVKYISNKNEPKTFYQCIVLVCFQAFLEAIQKNSEGIRISKENKIPSLKNVKDIEISKEDAEEALTFFPQSKMSVHFREIIKARLIQVDLDEASINLLLEKSIWGASSYINTIWSDLPDELKELENINISDWRKEKEFGLGLIKKLKKEAKKQEGEILSSFTKPKVLLNQVYVRLEVEEVDSNGYPILGQRPEDSHLWVRKKLFSNSLDKIILIQGDSGQGKSVFCSMFFGEIYKEIYPAYIPIIINLRELDSVQTTLSGTFESHLEFHPVSGYDGWLNDPVRRYLIFLDGFDEIALESQEIKRLTRRILDCQKNTHNQFLVTGRSIFSQEIEDFFESYSNIIGAQFCIMSAKLRSEWIDKWSLAIADVNAGIKFKEFLKKCPDEVISELAGEPLSLYLLAQLVQSKMISENDLLRPVSFEARSIIYQKALDIALEKVHETNDFQALKNQIDLDQDSLEYFLSEVASKFIFSNYRPIAISTVEDSFRSILRSSSESVPKLQATREARSGLERILKKLLTNFYARIYKSQGTQYLSFTHRSFSDFLYAGKIKNTLSNLINSCKENLEADEQIFGVLSYGYLSEEVSQYVIYHLLQDKSISSTPSKLKELFDKLYDLYWVWSNDFAFKNFQKTVPHVDVNLRHNDIHVGLNIIILLLKAYHLGDFSLEKLNLCENSSLSARDDEKLLRIIGYSYFLESQDSNEGACGVFSAILGKLFYNTRLENVKLQGVDLTNSDFHGGSFSRADLSRSKFSGANLSAVNFTRAILCGGDFRKSKMSDAVFRDANLDRANLSEADLRDADLSGSNLKETSFRKANLENAKFSLSEKNDDTEIYNSINSDIDDKILSIDESENLESNFENADFSGANLNKADFEGLDLSGINFKEADLREANFRNSILDGVCFQDADLRKTNFESAYLSGADFRGAKLQDATFMQASLKEIRHDSNTTWEGVRDLCFAVNLPKDLPASVAPS